MISNLLKRAVVFFIVSFYLLHTYPVTQVQAAMTKLHEFSTETGYVPMYSLAYDGSKFYGVTAGGGNNDSGVLYSINIDGSGYTVLHHFAEATGSSPREIVLVGSTIYGVTQNGGNNAGGVIYSINTNGTGYSVLHHGIEATGKEFAGELVYESGTLYGTSISGGANDEGTIFSMQSNGTGYTVLHHFEDVTDGRGPTSGLTKAGSILYGTTNFGGSVAESGTLFSINTNGSDFTVLHVFDESLQGGTPQNQKLIIDGTKIYGQTYNGGANGTGSVFSINTNGTGFTLLKSFNETTGLFRPTTSLYFDADTDTLYGGTQDGGEAENANGGYFSIQTDGSNYSEYLVFGGDGEDGRSPRSRPIFIEGILFGITSEGGVNGAGVLFRNSESGPTPSPTPTPSATPTPTPTPQNNSSNSPSSSNTSSNSAPSCSDTKPFGMADLFQINRTQNSATLFFTPVNDHVINYHVIYGFWQGDERFGQVGAVVTKEQNSGVQSITINSLDSRANYWFKVIPVNGCATGDWSNWLETKRTLTSTSFFYRW